MFRHLISEQRFARQTILLFGASMTGNVFSYLYLLYAARALGTETYGAFGSLFSIFYIFCLVGDSFRIAVASKVASTRSQLGDWFAVRRLVSPLIKLGVIGGIVIVMLMINSENIASFFHMETVGPVLVLGASLFTILLLFTILGFIQGLQLFGWLAWVGYLVPQSFKLVFGAVFIWVGWGLGGIIGALLASNAVAIAIGIYPLYKLSNNSSHSDDSQLMSARFSGIGVNALLIGLIICVPTSVDVMLVTHYFNSESASIYNAIATMGKVVLFLPIAVSLVMLPKVSQKHASDENTLRTLRLGLTYTLILSSGVTLIYWLTSDFIIRLAFGSEYSQAASHIGWYGTAMVFFAANYLIAQYNLATSDRHGVLGAILITLAEVVTITFLHNSLREIIMILLFGNLLLLTFNAVWLFVNRKRVPLSSQFN